MRTRMLGLLAVVAVLGVIGAACSSSSSGGSPSGSAAPSGSAVPSGGASSGGSLGTITIGSDTANNHGSKEVSGSSTFELEADNDGNDYYFDPTILTGSSGQKLTITVKNTGTTTHNFSLVNGSVSKDVQPGQTATVTVRFPKSGALEFYCRFHRNFGMVGELTTS
jgi:plastocyanin